MEERSLFIVFAIALAHGFDDGARVNAFMDMEGNGGNLKRGVLRFSSPD